MSFFQRQPLLFWASVWSVTLFLIWIAVASLTNPPVLQSDHPIAAPDPSAVTVSTPNAQTLYFWMFSLIILGCAIGSILILQRWGQRPPSKQSPKRLKRSTKQRTLTKAARSPVGVARAANPVPRATAASTGSRGGRSHPNSVRTPVVTVVPSEESHPLDWGEAGLAEMMDIRKRRPRPTVFR